MSDDWGNRGGEWAPSEADLLAAGYTFSGGDGGSWTPPPAPPAPPEPRPATIWNTPGQHLVLDKNSAKWTGNGYKFVADFVYNGVPVVFVPQEFVHNGLRHGNTTYYSNKWNQVSQYMKPAVIDAGAYASTPKGSSPTNNFWKNGEYSTPNQGYILPADVFNKTIKNFSYTTVSGGGGRSGFFKRMFSDFGQMVAELPGLAKIAISATVPGASAFFASFNATRAVQQGDWGGAVMAAMPLFVPSPSGAPPAISIPGIGKAVDFVSETFKVGPGTAGSILQVAVNLAATGGDFKGVLKNYASQYLGDKAGDFVSQFSKQFDVAGIEKISKAVVSSSTRAMLMNEDIGKAAAGAFAENAIPMALNAVPGYAAWAKSNPKLAEGLQNTAINAAKTGDPQKAIEQYTKQAFVDILRPSAEKALATEGFALNENQKKLLDRTIAAAVEGKPLDSALQSYALSEVRSAIRNNVAQAEGWESDAQKQTATAQYGSKVKPDEYVARQQGWEDLAAKQAAIKSYGDTVTPLGFKEREQVKSIDPEFDATAYAKLNEVTGDPFQHFLEQGQKSNLPTNYEDGAEKALAAIGYKADADEIKQVADLFKTSANPDVALNKFYDERWVTPEEAIATARQAGFDLTPGQVAAFTGQARSGQSTVFEDIGMAAKIGKESQQQRETFVNNYLADITKAYKEQGYTDAQIAAAMPEIRSRVNSTIEQDVKQLSDYASQAKELHGSASKEYADAKRKLLETQSALGGYGVVKESDQYKNISGETVKYDSPTTTGSWRFDQQREWAGLFDESGQEYTLGDYLKLPSGTTVYDETGKPAQVVGTGMSMEIRGTQQREIGTIAQIGKSAPEKLLSGPLSALFGGQEGGGAKAGTGFSLLGRTGDGDAIYGQEGSDFSLITYADGKTKAVNPRTQEVYLVPPEKVAEVIPKPPTAAPVMPQEQVPKTVQDIIKAADEKRISPQEAQKALEEAIGKAGYKATPEEIQQQIAALQGEKTPEQLQKEIGEYIDPRMVTAEEVKQMYRDLGLMEPTEADISRFTGQRAQSDLPEILKPYLPTASANVIAQQAQQDAARRAAIDSQIGGLDSRITELQRQGMSQMDATNKALAELTSGQAGLGQQLGQQQQQTQQQFGDVNARITELQRQGLSQAEATSRALAELASGQAGLGQQITGLQAGFGKALEGLAAGFGKTTAGLQQQLGQARQQAELGNLITILGLGQKQQQPDAPIPLVGQIKPYDFSSDLLQGIYKSPQAGLFGTNDQLLRMTRG